MSPESSKTADRTEDPVDEPGETAETVEADAAAADPPAATAEPSRWRRFAGPRRGRVLLAVAAVLLAAGVGVGAWMWTSALPADAAFEYDGRVVTEAELEDRAVALRALYGVERPSEPDRLDAFRRDLAKSVAVSMILDRAADERGIQVAEKQARDVLGGFVAEQFGDGGRDAFVRSLGNVGTSEPEVLAEITRQLSVGALMDEVIGEVAVGDEEVRVAFEQRQQQLGTPERRALRNIVVGSEAEAAAALEEIRAGAAFEDVAARRSLDASTKQSGGAIGELSREQLEAPVADAAFGVAAGELYGPVEGRFGWNVGRVDAVLPPIPARFEQVREQLRQTLQAEEGLRRWRDWLGAEIRAADVTYADRFRPADPDAAPGDLPGGPEQPPR